MWTRMRNSHPKTSAARTWQRVEANVVFFTEERYSSHMESIYFHCPGCKHVWIVPARMADLPATCPKCGGVSDAGGFPYTTPINTDQS